MKKIIKHYPMTDRLIVRRGYILLRDDFRIDLVISSWVYTYNKTNN